MTTNVLRTNFRSMEQVKVSVTFSSISAPTQETITVKGLKLGDVVILTNQWTSATGQMDYTISNPWVSAKDKLTFNVTPSFTPGTGGGFSTVSSGGVWYLTVLKPEYLANIPLNAAPSP